MHPIIRRLGIALICAGAAHYTMDILEPLAKAYKQPTKTQQLPIPELTPYKPIIQQETIDDFLAEAVYDPR